MTEDLKKLETLSYRPAKTSPETKEETAPVIKPGTGAKKGEVASQHLEQSNCKICDDTGRTKVICRPLDEEIPQYVPCKYCEKGKQYFDKMQPNYNLMIIEEIEGLMSQAKEKLYKLSTWGWIDKEVQRSKVVDEIDLFKNTTLRELRKVFE